MDYGNAKNDGNAEQRQQRATREPMPDRIQCEFHLLRYVPDAVKNEFVNIGVMLREAGRVDTTRVRFTRTGHACAAWIPTRIRRCWKPWRASLPRGYGMAAPDRSR